MKKARYKKSLLSALLTTALLACVQHASAQTVNEADRHEIVTKLADKLVDVYPFPEISAKYSEALKKAEAAGRYNNVSEDELASRLTEDLNMAHKDVHLRVMRNEQVYKNMTEPRSEGGSNREDDSERRANYGFKKVEIDGATSTAYIDAPGPFYGSKEAFEMAAAVMNMAAYSKNIIIDIRHNPGGTGQMGRFLSSYFYNAGHEQFYLNGFYKDRKQDEQEWTYAYVPGNRNPDAKVYLLVGRGTGSASEGFAYAMQKLNRATIVGDTTAGAGIAGTYVALKNNLIVFTPFKMVVGPGSNVGWEGTGVIPDVNTGKADALLAARKLILEDIVKNGKDSVTREGAQWVIDNTGMAANKPVNVKSKYGELIGKYQNNVSIAAGNGGLVYKYSVPGKPVESYVLQEVKADVLVINGLNANIAPNSSRVYIKRNAAGKIEGFTRKTMMANGTIYVAPQPYKKQ
ncbi:S41 family peptidase [Mucilaginibacter sp. UR6-1]|uniref:S41 family peptidase n=1 Tax=Mucilaginibacter sp. UR6-1 TaxID=1435643 RepID=UPI001E34C3D9|nr:S41 family peptidase [Mucilaginibacter sp. UR6-1]MCC8410886.1 S41 family peptidase [Mucilaginibacter sp. UR6-1]